jgi:hypothetical protein
MNAVRRFWDQAWFAQCDPLPGAMCRIFLGLLLCFYFLALAPNWDRFYGLQGIASLADGDLNASRPHDPLCVLAWTEGWLPIGVYWWLGLAASVLLALGCQTRTVSFILLVIISSLVHRNRMVSNGEEMVARTLLFYGCFAPWGKALSIDAGYLFSRHRTTEHSDLAQRTYAVWPLRLMQVNIALIYVISLPYKFQQDIAWLTGDALHWTMASDRWWTDGMFADLTLCYGGIFRKLMTWGTVLVEGGFPVLVWWPRTRLWAVGAMVLLHLGMALMIPGVTYFTLSMIVAAWLYVPAETIRGLIPRN